MEKARFKSPGYYWIILVVLILLSTSNLSMFLTDFDIKTLIALIIQIVLIVLLVIRSPFARLGIKIWATLSLIIGPILVIAGRMIKELGNFEKGVDLQLYISNFALMAAGVLIIVYSNKTIEVADEEKPEQKSVAIPMISMVALLLVASAIIYWNTFKRVEKGWTQEDKEFAIKNCMGGAKSMTAEDSVRSRRICTCVIDSISKKYTVQEVSNTEVFLKDTAVTTKIINHCLHNNE